MRRMSFFATRKPKEKVGLDELRDQWRRRAEPYRDDLDKLQAVARERGEQPIETDPSTARRAALFGIRQSETREAVNNIGRLYRTALASHVGEVRFADVRPLFDTQEAGRKLFVTVRQTGDQPLPRGRTSRRTAKLELAMYEHISLAMRDASPDATAERLTEVAAAQGLTSDQNAALVAPGCGPHRAVGGPGARRAGKATPARPLARAPRDAH